uniref:Ig-like domain-containing protein n=1 Tax=Theropithecus gelada TaxID=9565 RepID=A0A8D2GHQ0_THEGE
MMILQVSGHPWTVDLTALLMVLLISVVQGWATPENSVYQERQECYAFNGTQRFVDGLIYNREEYVHFDSAVGEFLAVMELGRPTGEYLNSQKDFMERKRAEVDKMCRHKYELMEPPLRQRRVQLRVNVSRSKKGPLQHHNLLVCHVTDFHPGTGVVSTSLIRNGDWAFQILVLLEMTPQQGDVYTCQVEHPSLDSPVTVEWKAQSDSTQSKTLTGAAGCKLGLIICGVGIFMHRRSKKVQQGSA